MILEILWCPIFAPVVIVLGFVPFLPQVCPVFIANYMVKMGHL